MNEYKAVVCWREYGDFLPSYTTLYEKGESAGEVDERIRDNQPGELLGVDIRSINITKL